MPIYLAQPGVSSKEPWRHGLQVYERPFPINLESSSETRGDNNEQHHHQLRPTMRHDTTLSQSHSSLNNNEGPNDHHNINESTTSANSSTATLSSAVAGMTHQQIIDHDIKLQATINSLPKPLRRIRHSEIVLVDQCLIAYGRYWLRLKWPGEQGGHGGYVALYENYHHQQMNEGGEGGRGESSSTVAPTAAAVSGAGDDGNNIVNSSSSVTTTSVMCTQTNVLYPTSGVLKLLPSYDDGLNNENIDNSNNNNNNGGGDEILISLETGEPVFCRICREGLHDVNTDYLETTTPPSSSTQQQQQSSSGVANNAVDDEADEGSPGPTLSGREGRSSSTGDSGRDVGVNAAETVANTEERESSNTAGEKSSSLCPTVSNELPGSNGAVTIPPITRFHPSAENPLLAPCLCTGSMAFVHYLCVEQWRCRSRHPGARNGLNCETCNAEYTLPPPPSRPNRGGIGGIDGVGNNNMMVDDDWLDAMPPHVLAALRRPHPWWQLGAAVVRRRWLRPIVPVLASPLVALYCKARRTLKKRGVSRRRWACSLCRRRARWKCVRCLRSYYCSRQCQNVSWHIVHKHVCYKPVRFWWSVVVYTLGTLILVPGIVKNFPIYDTSATLLPVNFVAMGNIAGGVASTLKRTSGIDIRGRILEVSVILCTLFLTAVSSGVVRAYFGDSSQCWGVLASPFEESPAGTPPGPFTDSASNKALSTILHYAQLYYRKWDFLCARTGILSRFICTPTDDGNADFATIGCSSPVRSINPEFYLEEESCRADIGVVVGIWFAAFLVHSLEHLYRSYRVRRRAAVHLHRGRQRPHQD